MNEQKVLLKSQQGELDAALMYQKVAEKISNPEVKKLVLKTASEEGRHAAVFFKLTGKRLKPKKFKSVIVPQLMRIIGKKKTFELMAKGEYNAVNKYATIVDKYPSVLSVQQEEKIHGDRMSEISKIYKEDVV